MEFDGRSGKEFIGIGRLEGSGGSKKKLEGNGRKEFSNCMNFYLISFELHGQIHRINYALKVVATRLALSQPSQLGLVIEAVRFHGVLGIQMLESGTSMSLWVRRSNVWSILLQSSWNSPLKFIRKLYNSMNDSNDASMNTFNAWTIVATIRETAPHLEEPWIKSRLTGTLGLQVR
ncbi:hypothetical protein Cgig2_003644 [Carnegiea gigantea]|uniref:Uncharacterized protein n=1 Tax=Carnegiea gigantea TaxID=171969 RepID=A0A9Q1GR34_9CARY|nr:hypothetical protein Cgig2_003644 [Carnegiea gigantea]